jgi:hypothetical protein
MKIWSSFSSRCLKFKSLVWSAHTAGTRREGIYYFFIAQYENSLA